MSWLFGSRKKKSEPEVEVKDLPQQDTYDDFECIPPLSRPTSLPYYPPIPTIHSSYQAPLSPVKAANPLDSIPFRFSPRLEDGCNSTLFQSDLIRFSTYFKNINEELKSHDLNYNFELEKSVLQEASLFNGMY